MLTRSNREMPAWWAFLLKVVQRGFLWPLVKSSTNHDSTDSWDSQHHQVGSWPGGIGIQQTLLEKRFALDHAIEKTWDSGLLIKQSYKSNLSFYMWCIESYSGICCRYRRFRRCGCSEQPCTWKGVCWALTSFAKMISCISGFRVENVNTPFKVVTA